MSRLGIYASQISGHLASPTSYESIATVALSSNQSTISFSSIPSTYKHLQLRIIARADHPTYGGVDGLITFNGDTGANYSWHYLLGYGQTTVLASATPNASNIIPGIIAAASGSPSGVYAASIIDILDYANVNKYKTTRSIDGLENNQTSGRDLRFASGSWRSTSAINSISIVTSPSQNFIQYSSFALYGIKG